MIIKIKWLGLLTLPILSLSAIADTPPASLGAPSCYDEQFSPPQAGKLDIILLVQGSEEGHKMGPRGIQSQITYLTHPILWTRDVRVGMLRSHHSRGDHDRNHDDQSNGSCDHRNSDQHIFDRSNSSAERGFENHKDKLFLIEDLTHSGSNPMSADSFFRAGATLAVVSIQDSDSKKHNFSLKPIPSWLQAKLRSNPSNIFFTLSESRGPTKDRFQGKSKKRQDEGHDLLYSIDSLLNQAGNQIETKLEQNSILKSYSWTPEHAPVDASTLSVMQNSTPLSYEWNSILSQIEISPNELRSPDPVDVKYCLNSTSPGPTPSPVPSSTSTPSPVPSPTPIESPTPVPSSTSTPSPVPSPTPTVTPAPSPSPTSSQTPTCSGLSCGVFGI